MTALYSQTKKQFDHGGNCVLEATWQVRKDLSTKVIHDAYVRTGKYEKGGVRDQAWMTVFAELGIGYRNAGVFQHMSSRRKTVGQFARQNPVGVFFIAIKGHALAIVNGEVVDPNFTYRGGKPKLQARVEQALQITNPVVKNK